MTESSEGPGADACEERDRAQELLDHRTQALRERIEQTGRDYAAGVGPCLDQIREWSEQRAAQAAQVEAERTRLGEEALAAQAARLAEIHAILDAPLPGAGVDMSTRRDLDASRSRLPQATGPRRVYPDRVVTCGDRKTTGLVGRHVYLGGNSLEAGFPARDPDTSPCAGVDVSTPVAAGAEATPVTRGAVRNRWWSPLVRAASVALRIPVYGCRKCERALSHVFGWDSNTRRR